VKLIRLLLSLGAVCAVIFFGLNRTAEWRGEVRMGGTLPVADATVVVLSGTKIVSMARTQIDGTFRINLQRSPGKDGHLIVCRPGLEPAVASWADRGTNGSLVQLEASRPGDDPLVASVRKDLPEDCK
jgi:hypothetical protein